MKTLDLHLSIMKPIALLFGATLALGAFAQAKPQVQPATDPKKAGPSVDEIRRAAIQKQIESQHALVSRAEREGVGARLDALCHFRGTWSQQLLGIGLVTGLEGTGDSQSYTATAIAAGNLLKKYGVGVDTTSSNFQSKNIALVTVSCELPPYSSPGQRIDVTVSTMGDSKSLRNGTLLYTPLKYPGSDDTYAVAMGAVSVGGYSASSGGSSTRKGFVTVGKVPAGAIVQQAVPTNTVFDGKMYLDLDQEDITTAERIEEKITETYPELSPRALGAGTVELILPKGETASSVQSRLMSLIVQANTEARIVVDERSGTIVIGGMVRIGPCAIARGSISVTVTQDYGITAPLPLTAGGASAPNTTVSTQEETAQITTLRPNTTVADLAEIFQALKLHADDIIAILENMRAQGVLKAKLVIQ
jgi:flagellar P-ring protein precursor FlgI